MESILEVGGVREVVKAVVAGVSEGVGTPGGFWPNVNIGIFGANKWIGKIKVGTSGKLEGWMM